MLINVHKSLCGVCKLLSMNQKHIIMTFCSSIAFAVSNDL